MDIKDRIDNLLPPRSMSIDPPGTAQVVQQEDAGTVTTVAEALASSKERIDTSSVRKILAITLTVFILLCLGAYFIYMMTIKDTQGLSNFVTVLVGVLGIITGYYFGSRKETSK